MGLMGPMGRISPIGPIFQSAFVVELGQGGFNRGVLCFVLGEALASAGVTEAGGGLMLQTCSDNCFAVKGASPGSHKPLD